MAGFKVELDHFMKGVMWRGCLQYQRPGADPGRVQWFNHTPLAAGLRPRALVSAAGYCHCTLLFLPSWVPHWHGIGFHEPLSVLLLMFFYMDLAIEQKKKKEKKPKLTVKHCEGLLKDALWLRHWVVTWSGVNPELFCGFPECDREWVTASVWASVPSLLKWRQSFPVSCRNCDYLGWELPLKICMQVLARICFCLWIMST